MPPSQISEVSGKRLYAIGDLHGCPEELEVLLQHLRTAEGLGAEDTVVFLGDFIDRGPDSKNVVELCIQFKNEFPSARYLKGNHEDMLLDFLGYGGRMGQAFLYNGGIETIQSYGISVFSPPEEMVQALPESHYKFYQELESILVNDDFVFVHAGLNPLRDLRAQNDGDIFWIRDEFINNVHPFKKLIVFGHTPHRDVLIHKPFKLGIDTGLVFGNKLTCVELRGGRQLQVERGKKVVEVKELGPLAPPGNQPGGGGTLVS